ncbi:MAG: crossover junction endodeoxyribonuclease RuvC [Candidatus Planktophila sp.]|jgi:crossover junction endodeoxyribonuclease RuvC|nr:crossover junction endodeoxyribonuclease RuvC [Candidatus Planktophila sp.]MBP7902759.1 crossover junction endodeoxyribonuclease RuvC [Candidatus Planktophila sp.]
MSKAKIIMGIDPGLTRCGVGVISQKSARDLTLVGVGVILTPVDAPLEERLLGIEREIELWIERNKPDVVAVERVFAQHNVRTVMGTGQAAGIALLVAARRGIPVAMHTPSEVKAAVTGSGRAGKVQVAEMVKRILNLEVIPKPVDATDSLALAITHAWRGENTSRLAAAVKAEKERLAKLRAR